MAGNEDEHGNVEKVLLEAACVAGNTSLLWSSAAWILEAACVAGNLATPPPLTFYRLEAACVAGNGTKNLRNGPGTGLQGSYLEKPMLLGLLRQLPDY